MSTTAVPRVTTKEDPCGILTCAYPDRLMDSHFAGASGSGSMEHDPTRIYPKCTSTAFRIATILRSQSTAFNSVKGRDGRPLIVEIRDGCFPPPVYNTGGHWPPDLTRHDRPPWPQDAVLVDAVGRIRATRWSAPLRYDGRDGAVI